MAGEEEAVISAKLARKCGIRVGDTVTLRTEGGEKLKVKVAALSETIFIITFIFHRKHGNSITEVIRFTRAFISMHRRVRRRTGNCRKSCWHATSFLRLRSMRICSARSTK